MDESGIHDGAEVVVVAAYVGRPKTWREWTKEWKLAKYPIKVFHAVDCANFKGEYEGWDKARRDPYVANLLPIMPAHELAGIVIGIHLSAFKKEIDAHPELKEMFGELYSACFQWAVSIILDFANERGKGERMTFVHEQNNYRGDASKAFAFVKANLNPRNIPVEFKFGAKADYPPLQAADVLAYEGAKFIKNPTGQLRRAWVALDPDKTRIMVRRYGPDNMGSLVATLSQYRAKLVAQGWDGSIIA